MTTMTKEVAYKRLYEACKRVRDNRPTHPHCWMVDTMTPLVDAIEELDLPEPVAETRARREIREAENTLNAVMRERRELEERELKATEKLTAAQQLLRDANTLADVNAAREAT